MMHWVRDWICWKEMVIIYSNRITRRAHRGETRLTIVCEWSRFRHIALSISPSDFCSAIENGTIYDRSIPSGSRGFVMKIIVALLLLEMRGTALHLTLINYRYPCFYEDPGAVWDRSTEKPQCFASFVVCKRFLMGESDSLPMIDRISCASSRRDLFHRQHFPLPDLPLSVLETTSFPEVWRSPILENIGLCIYNVCAHLAWPHSDLDARAIHVCFPHWKTKTVVHAQYLCSKVVQKNVFCFLETVTVRKCSEFTFCNSNDSFNYQNYGMSIQDSNNNRQRTCNLSTCPGLWMRSSGNAISLPTIHADSLRRIEVLHTRRRRKTCTRRKA